MRYPSSLVVLLVFIALFPAGARGQSDGPVPTEKLKELHRQTDAAVETKRIQLAIDIYSYYHQMVSEPL